MQQANTLSEFAGLWRDFTKRSRQTGFISPPDDSFNTLALCLFHLQYETIPLYRRLCQARQISPENCPNWQAIPAVPQAAFKEFDLTSLPASERAHYFVSSGTTQTQRSHHYHNALSLDLYKESLIHWFNCCLIPGLPDGSVFGSPPAGGERQTALEFPGTSKANEPPGQRLLILSPTPQQAPNSSLVYMFDTLREQLGADKSAFAGTINAQGDWDLCYGQVMASLEEAVASQRAMSIWGTAFGFVHLLDYLARQQKRYVLPPGSMAMETGGYKGKSRTMAKEELYGLITQRLGIAPRQIVCEYGMCELNSQAYDWQNGQASASDGHRLFHFPPWVRTRILSPETNGETAPGEPGLLVIYDLANVWSIMAIQTEDLAIRQKEGFILLGRSAEAVPRGCSIFAHEPA